MYESCFPYLDGSDFIASSDLLTVDNINNSLSCTSFSVLNDNIVENLETFTIELSTVEDNITLSPSSGTVTIIDNGEVVRIVCLV